MKRQQKILISHLNTICDLLDQDLELFLQEKFEKKNINEERDEIKKTLNIILDKSSYLFEKIAGGQNGSD